MGVEDNKKRKRGKDGKLEDRRERHSAKHLQGGPG